MTKKVTGKELEKLIEGVLSEKDSFNQQDLGKYFANTFSKGDVETGSDPGLRSVPLDSFFADDGLATKGPPTNELSVTDIQHYIDNPQEIDTKIQSQLIAVKKQGSDDWHKQRIQKQKAKVASLQKKYKDMPKGPGAKNARREEHKKEKLDPESNKLAEFEKAHGDLNDDIRKLSIAADLALKSLEQKVGDTAQKQQSISSPSIKTAKGDYGIFDKDQIAVVDRLLAGKTTIKDKITEVSKISKDFYDAVTDKEALANKKPSQLLTEIMLIDIFNSMVKEFDSGAGAYLFEHFLAMIVGGSVSGKEKTEFGKMGAADFRMGDEYGSAKFYQNAKQAEQAVSGYVSLFKQNKDKPVSVTYVIAAKKQDVDQIGNPTRGSSDPARIIGAEIYTPKVVFDGEDFTINGEPAGNVSQSNIKFNSDQKLGASVGTIFVTTTRTATFKEMLENGIAQQEQDVKVLFESFKQYFKQLEQASSSAKTYIASGNIDDGNKTYESLAGAETSFTAIASGLEYGKKPAKGGGPQQLPEPPIAEQKITAKMLQKLIEENFKK